MSNPDKTQDLVNWKREANVRAILHELIYQVSGNEISPLIDSECTTYAQQLLQLQDESNLQAIESFAERLKLPEPVEVGAKYEIERDWPGIAPEDGETAHMFGYDHGYNKALLECRSAIDQELSNLREGK